MTPLGQVRDVEEKDAADILRLITDLAIYEREPDAVKNTEQAIVDHLFCDQPALFGHVIEDEIDGERTVVGMALWFLTYSTWEGVHGIWLEDLYVMPEMRGKGYGKALLQKLASIATERGYARVEWTVLDWNEPSIKFYENLGAIPMSEWTTYRLTDDALAAFGGAQ